MSKEHRWWSVNYLRNPICAYCHLVRLKNKSTARLVRQPCKARL